MTISPTRDDLNQVAVIGAGYVGLTTGVCFSSLGHQVVLADVDPKRIELLQQGRCPIYEPGMERLMRESREAHTISYSTDATTAVRQAEFVYLCVPTPQDPSGAADLSYIESAARRISLHLRPGAVVVNKSTVPVGTAEQVARWIGRDDIEVVSNPEFLREGSAVKDFQNPDRIVIGADHRATALRVAALYVGITAPLVLTDTVSAELVKYAANSYLALRLSFVNEIAAMCDRLGADAADVMTGFGTDKRIGTRFLDPGPGWGGSCFPKDTRALAHMAHESGRPFTMLESAIDANDHHTAAVVDRIRIAADGELDGRRIGVLGLTYKAGTDDLRDSPSLRVTDVLLDRGAEVTAHDPALAMKPTLGGSPRLDGIRLVEDPLDVCKDADVVVVMTEWDSYRDLDLAAMSRAMSGMVLVDTRNLLDPDRVARHGLDYVGTGRRRSAHRPVQEQSRPGEQPRQVEGSFRSVAAAAQSSTGASPVLSVPGIGVAVSGIR